MNALEICKNTGEQLSLLGEKLVVTDNAIIDSNSLARAGVRRVGFCGAVVDFEIFDSGQTRAHEGDLEVYPLDGRNDPIPVEANGASYTSDEELRALVSSVLVARALGQ